jgi:uncharacterized protein
MNTKRNILAAALAAASISGTSAQAADSGAALAGTWSGVLKAGALSLKVEFELSSEAGALAAALSIPDQGVKGLPFSSASVEGKKLRLASASIQAAYEGELSADGARIAGDWIQGGARFPLTLERGALPTLNRPQEPKPPFPYRTEEVVIENAAGGSRLAGTLTLPAAPAAGRAGGFPAVLMLTGSGAQNRDEEIFGHKPFLVLADYLARRGIASLRCDDRGVGGSTGEVASATTLDFAGDAEAAFEYLASRPEIAKGAVGLLGHSEGGMIAPIVAARNPKVAFLVLLAGPGLSGMETLKLQAALIARAQGASERDIAESAEVNAKLYAIAAGPGDAASVTAELRKTYLAWIEGNKSLSAADKAKAAAAADGTVGPLASPWFRTFLGLDPAPYLARVGVPVLALFGTKDLQVPSKESAAGMRAALGATAPGGPSGKNAVVELPGLNHLFQDARTGSPDEYGTIEETFSPEALKRIGDWIQGL